MAPPPAYIPRSMEPGLRRAAAQFPAVVLTGPRQSGKTTLLRRLFGDQYRYVSLELPDVRAAAVSDPRGFLALYPPPVILDEVQYAAAELLPYVKERIDEDRAQPGQFLLSGSQNLLLLERVSESLAGRAAILRLLPLSLREIRRSPAAPLPWEQDDTGHPSAPLSVAPAHGDLWQQFLTGGYPELWAGATRDLGLWHASYVQTYLERDIRSMRQIGDLTLFQAFLRALAAGSAQVLNLSELSRDLGVAVNTVKAWLSLLEATHQILVLRPHHRNFRKRLVKSPKVYFLDTGTLCHLTGLSDPRAAAQGPMAGAIFETAVITEVYKRLLHRAEDPRLSFYRTAAGLEVDLLVESEGRVVLIEAKRNATPRPLMARAVAALRDDLGDRAGPGYVVHPGDVTLPLRPGVTALPLGAL